MSTVYKPSLCVVAQGVKRVLLGSESYLYDSGSYLAASVHLPVTGQVIEASQAAPYLSLQLQFEMDQVLDVIQQSNFKDQPRQDSYRGIVVSQVSDPLHEAIMRLIGLLDTPDDLPVLAPMQCARYYIGCYRLNRRVKFDSLPSLEVMPNELPM
ncbi:AraC family transcriptional regulator [Paenibacillus pabuli]|uniref:AraC family transcriptional regulator n=1 Tax=Paenibacillus pabuli TaxID=1472 RepID=UPI0032B56805